MGLAYTLPTDPSLFWSYTDIGDLSVEVALLLASIQPYSLLSGCLLNLTFLTRRKALDLALPFQGPLPTEHAGASHRHVL